MVKRISPALLGAKSALIRDLGPCGIADSDPRLHYYVGETRVIDPTAGEARFLYGSGTGVTRVQARERAIGETIEKYCAFQFARNAFRIESYRNLSGPRFDPRDYPLFTPNQFRKRNFRFARFRTDSPLSWTVGKSLMSGKKLYVPAVLTSPFFKAAPAEKIFQYEGTGLAAHRSFERATSSGICEIVERDAFMLTWLNRLPVPTVEFDGCQTPCIEKLRAAIAEKELELKCFYLTLDIALPVFLALLYDRRMMRFIVSVGAACHSDKFEALEKAIREAIQGRIFIRDHIGTYRKSLDIRRVRTPAEHAVLYSVLKRIDVFDFLLHNERTVRLDSIPDGAWGPALADGAVLAKWIRALGKEVIAVDMTHDDVHCHGYWVIRTLIPGMQPLNFGADAICLNNPRIFRIAKDMGYRRTHAKESNLNRNPHPFA